MRLEYTKCDCNYNDNEQFISCKLIKIINMQIGRTEQEVA